MFHLFLKNYSHDNDVHAIIIVLSIVGVLDYSDYGPGRDPFRSLTEKKLKETVSLGWS